MHRGMRGEGASATPLQLRAFLPGHVMLERSRPGARTPMAGLPSLLNAIEDKTFMEVFEKVTESVARGASGRPVQVTQAQVCTMQMCGHTLFDSAISSAGGARQVSDHGPEVDTTNRERSGHGAHGGDAAEGERDHTHPACCHADSMMLPAVTWRGSEARSAHLDRGHDDEDGVTSSDRWQDRETAIPERSGKDAPSSQPCTPHSLYAFCFVCKVYHDYEDRMWTEIIKDSPYSIRV